jgi:hypothetical protein
VSNAAKSYAAHKTRRRAAFPRDGCYGQVHRPEPLIACVARLGDTTEAVLVDDGAAVPVALEAGDHDADAADDGVASVVTVVVLGLLPLPHDANAAAARVGTVIVVIARNNANSHESYRPERACSNLAPAPRGGPPHKRLTSTRTQGDRPAKHSAFCGSRSVC